MQPHQVRKFISFRNHTKSDHSFLFATYLRNCWYSPENMTTLKKSTWMSLQHKRLEGILASEQPIKIACLAEDPDVIVGYAFQDGKRPFCYVKLAWRNPNLSIGKLLLEELSK